MEQNIINIIKSISYPQPNINPTVIYNEGWMTRLLVLQSIKEGLSFEGLDFSKFKNWTSEALIGSPFLHVDKESREGYTHADIALGDFKVNFSDNGAIIIDSNAKHSV